MRVQKSRAVEISGLGEPAAFLLSPAARKGGSSITLRPAGEAMQKGEYKNGVRVFVDRVVAKDLEFSSAILMLSVRGELRLKFFHRATEIIKSHMQKSEGVFVKGAIHELRIMTPPETFNLKVLEFLARN